ncbi:MAG TPA: ShlB/FhaC/HecB family hemolysin secretion/activation protein [Steroidobacteraceae bacterium]|nr:ShlB/FhaC/HecB family hemolysin secretion/activation protein [Steroidobacteraceae bacterium]
MRLAASAAALVIFAAAARATPEEATPLVAVAIDGSTVYSPADLFPAYRDHLGRPVSREAARAVAAVISERYRVDGFARPELRLDETFAADGIMHIRVFEPRVTRVTIEGDPGRYRDAIEHIGAEVTAAVPLRLDTIRNAVSGMLRLSGLAVTAKTRRDGAAPNAHELVLQADFAPLSGYARMNNRGTGEVGPLFVLGQLVANDPFGWGGAAGLVLVAAGETSEYLSGAAWVDRPLGGGGTRGLAMVFRSSSAPNERPQDLRDEYERERISLRVTRPLGGTYAMHGALEAENLTIDRDAAILRDDRLRVLEAGVRGGWRAGDASQLSSSAELRKGLDVLGAGLRADDLPDDPRSADFLVVQLQFSSFTRLPDSWSLRVDAFAQASGDVLPDVERFKIGGERLGRGFEVAEIAGDHGLGGKVQVRRELPAAEISLGSPSVYGFYDLGAAWKNDVPGRESAATLGVGVGLQGTRLSSYVEVAKPLTHPDVEGKRSASLFAEVAWKF